MNRGFVILLGVLIAFFSIQKGTAQTLSEGFAAKVEGDFVTAFFIWSKLESEGNFEAKIQLAEAYHFGLGVTQNPEKAFTLFLQAAQKQPYFGFNVGVAFEQGIGIYQDYKKAAEWYEIASSSNPYAQCNLGGMYASGRGVIKDPLKAHMWANIASSASPDDGCKLRDYLEQSLTPNQLDQSLKLARNCVEKEYKDC